MRSITHKRKIIDKFNLVGELESSFVNNEWLWITPCLRLKCTPHPLSLPPVCALRQSWISTGWWQSRPVWAQRRWLWWTNRRTLSRPSPGSWSSTSTSPAGSAPPAGRACPGWTKSSRDSVSCSLFCSHFLPIMSEIMLVLPVSRINDQFKYFCLYLSDSLFRSKWLNFLSLHREKKKSFDLKSWVTGGTEIRPNFLGQNDSIFFFECTKRKNSHFDIPSRVTGVHRWLDI